MKIKINENNEVYSLSIDSGHFSGTLTSIPREKLKELADSINRLLDDDSESGVELVWNPRANRLERSK